MIRFSQVSKRYPGGYDALRNISFALDTGEMAVLTGPSGAGKSTLMKLIALIERPSRGQVLVNQKNLDRIGKRRLPYFRREVGMIFQDNRLLTDRSVYDNVALPLLVAGCDPRELPRRVRASLDKVGLLGKEKLNPVVLSGGEQQRVGIARAIVNRPPLLLADEPTGNLDARLSDEILDLFLDFHHHGTTVLIATHDTRLIERARTRVLGLDRGELVRDTSPS